MTPRRLKDILWVLAIFGAVAVALRLLTGLGRTTDLSDGMPWGIWKVLNMIAGVALATGGFVLAFVVHVLGLRRFRPIVRPAILVAMLGYGSSCFALLMDIGLPHRFWHPFLFWNEHSFLFEVFWCVVIYFSITMLEFAPIALEDGPLPKLRRFLKKISLPVVVLGITLSTMHHTSLGSLFLMSPTRIHPIWYSGLLPVLFILSAIGGGMMAVVLVTLGIAHLYRRRAPTELLGKVAAAAAVVLSLYFALKIGDLAVRGELGDVFSGRWEGRLFLVETLLLAIVPIALLAFPRIRRSPGGLAAAGLAAVAGVVLNRLDVGVFGFLRSSGASYVPTLSELALSLGIPAAAGLAFLALVERFRVFESFGRLEDPAVAPDPLAFDPHTGVWRMAFLDGAERVTLIALLAVPLSVALFTATASAKVTAAQAVAVEPPLATDPARAILEIDGDRDGTSVTFPHADHQRRLGGEDSCVLCHHLDLPNDHFPACWRCHTDMYRAASIFDHAYHVRAVAKREGYPGRLAGNRTCAICHPADRPRNGDSAAACTTCHEKDMRMPKDGRALAPSYSAALHASCVGCHEERAARAGRPDLPECATCHGEKR